MSMSGSRKDKRGKSNGVSHDKNEGTSARTRPISVKEIMLRRKHNKLPENIMEGTIETEKTSAGDIIENISVNLQAEKGRHDRDSFPSKQKRGDVERNKISSRKQEERPPMKDEHIVEEKHRSRHETETKLKDKMSKYIGNKDKEGKTETLARGRRKTLEQSSDGRDKEFEKRHSRDSLGKNRYQHRSEGKSERESKRKNRNGEDEKIRDKDSAKKHEPREWHDSEMSEKKDRRESSKSHFEESRPKRRRSRSREHEDRKRRPSSLSPKAHQRTSYYEHGRQHSDVDRSQNLSNGLSGQYQRHGASTSGLGGYSPRKRKSEAAIKTPSPTIRSPEKRSAGWDRPPARRDSTVPGPDPPNFQLSNQSVSSSMLGLMGSVPVASSTVMQLPVVTPNILSTKKNVSGSVDSIQLTQATRPMRRLRIENLPASVSEKTLMECINNSFLSSGANHVQGTQPCISCTIHKEKGQAVVEFLTPEDASAALSFDGISFSGSILKIRRPKDFNEVATGYLEKSAAAADTISNIVKDSPHKIFIGGISKSLSSKMVMEIASAFGPLKAFHLEAYEDQPRAFLEYADQLVTLKACAGLNGMKLGGQVLTVVQAVPNASSLENTGDPPFYGIPEHAKPLLEQPTQVIKLQNVFDRNTLSSVSELEVEEVLEDIRLECARFGIVRSVNIVRPSDIHIPTSAHGGAENSGFVEAKQILGDDEKNTKVETLDEVSIGQPRNLREEYKFGESSCTDNKYSADVLKANESCQPGQPECEAAVENPACNNASGENFQQIIDQLNNEKDPVENDEVGDTTQGMQRKLISEEESNSVIAKGTSGDHPVQLDGDVGREADVIKEDNKNEDIHETLFGPGCVVVEFGRIEASCAAAHCLHGRLFDDRTVTVDYVAQDVSRARFPK